MNLWPHDMIETKERLKVRNEQQIIVVVQGTKKGLMASNRAVSLFFSRYMNTLEDFKRH